MENELSPITVLLFSIIIREAEEQNVPIDMSDVATFCALYDSYGLSVAIELALEFRNSLMDKIAQGFESGEQTIENIQGIAGAVLQVTSMDLTLEVAKQFVLKR